MAGLQAGMVYTLRDLALHGDFDQQTSDVINMLSQANPMLEDAVWEQGNLDTGHRFMIIDGLPEINYRSINQGVLPTRSSRRDITETCSLLEAVSQIDKELVDIASNGAVFRMMEAQAHIEAMANKFASGLWYGTRIGDPRSIIGLTQSYTNLTGPAHRQIIDATPTSGTPSSDENASIWLIVWGQKGLHCIYPKNTRAGIEYIPGTVIDLDDVDPDGTHHGTYQGYRDRYKWRVGLCLKDFRQVGRICNIDMTRVRTFGTANDVSPDLADMLLSLTHRIHNLGDWGGQDTSPQGGLGVPSFSGKAVIYMNRDLKEFYERQLMRKQNLALTINERTGKIITSFKGIPIKVDDNLLSTEERVV